MSLKLFRSLAVAFALVTAAAPAFATKILTPPAGRLVTTINMPSGRSYSAPAGGSISVPDFDAEVLQANGWTTVPAAIGAQTAVTLSDGTVSTVGASLGAANAMPGVSGRTPLAFSNWRKAIARVKLGLGKAVVVVDGDSTTTAWGAGNGTNGLTGSYALSPTVQMAKILAANFLLPTQTDSFIGNHAMNAATVQLANPAITLNAGWNVNTFPCIGGSCFEFNTNTAVNATMTALTNHPISNFDTVDIIYKAIAGGCSFNVNVNNGSAIGSAVNTGATPDGTFKRVTISGLSLVNQYFNIVPVANSGTCEIAGEDVYASTSPKVSVQNWGWIGAKTADISTTTAAIIALAPDLVILDEGINDWLNGVPVATAQSNIQAEITAIKAGSPTTDIVLVVPNQSSTVTAGTPPGVATLAVQNSYQAMEKAVAAAAGVPVVDMAYRFGPFTSTGDGYHYDDVHFNAAGYLDKATALANAIGSP